MVRDLDVRALLQVRIDSVVLPSSVEHPETKERKRTRRPDRCNVAEWQCERAERRVRC